MLTTRDIAAARRTGQQDHDNVCDCSEPVRRADLLADATIADDALPTDASQVDRDTINGAWADAWIAAHVACCA
jgi:hypothetical protein